MNLVTHLLVGRQVGEESVGVGVVPVVLVEAVGEAFVLYAAQIIRAVVLQAYVATLERHLFLVLATTEVVLKFLIEDFLELL